LSVHAQGQQECLSIVGSSQTANTGDQVCVEMTTSNFVDVAGLQYTHSFDESVLSFNEVQVSNAISISSGNFGVLQAGNGTVQFSWVSLNVTNVSLPDNTLLYSLCFDVIGQPTESSTISLTGEQTAIEALTLDGFDPVEININGVSGKVSVGVPTDNDPYFASTCSTAASCGGTSSGSATITVEGGIAPYSYVWIGPNGYVNTVQNVNDLPAGLYTCEATDSDGSVVTATFYISSDDAADISVDAQVTAESCLANDGSIVIVPNTSDPLTYLWSNGATTPAISGLSSGTYYLTITDQGGCTEVFTYVVEQNTSLETSVEVEHNTAFCSSTANGAIDLSIMGGSQPYSYTWSNNAMTEDLTGLEPGVYEVVITDADGCQVTLSITVLNVGMATNYTYECVNDDSGVLTYVIWNTADLTTGLTFEWSNGTTTTPSNDYINDGNAITEVAFSGNGLLSVTLTDDSGCNYTEDLANVNCGSDCDDLVIGHTWACTVVDPDNAMVTFTSVVWNPEAGTAPYTMSYSDGTTITGVEINDYVLGEHSILNPTDTVVVTITDAVGCVFTYEYNDFECGNSGGDCADDWLVGEAFECTIFTDFSQAEVTVALWDAPSGVAPFIVEWDNGDVTTMAEISGGSYTASAIYINPGMQVTYTIIDAEGCQTTGSVPVDCPDPTPDPGVQNQDCGVILSGVETTGSVGDNICVPFTMSSSEVIVSVQYSLEWNPNVLTFTGVQSFGLNGVNSSSFGQNNVNAGKLTYAWFDPNVTGVVMTSDVVHYEVCFDIIGNTGDYSLISYSNDPTPIEVANADFEVVTDLQLLNSYVGVETWNPAINASLNCATNWLCQGVSDGFIDVLFQGGQQPLTYEWTGPNGFTANTEDLSGLAAGIYSCVGTDVNGNAAWITVEIDEVVCIWPGDTDASGIVNNYDLLNIGLGYSEIGPARANEGIDWVGQYGDDWTVATPNSNTNYKHTDADGSGQVNEADVDAINLNWGLTTDGLASEDSERDLPTVINNAPTVPFFVEEVLLEEAQAASLTIMLGDDANTVSDAYGVAFSIEYDSEYIVGGSTAITIENSWLGNANDELLIVQKDFFADGRIDVAITRKDGNPVTGFGEIGRLEVVIEDIIFANNDESEEIIMVPFTITNVLVINQLEEAIASEGMETFSQLNIETGTDEYFVSEQVSVFPNPASSFVNVNAGDLMMEDLLLYDVTGKLILQQAVNSLTAKINVKHLAEGTYLMKVHTPDGVANKRIIIVK